MKDSTTVTEEALKNAALLSQKMESIKTATEVLQAVADSLSELPDDMIGNEDTIYWMCVDKLDDATNHDIPSFAFLGQGIIDALYKYAMASRAYIRLSLIPIMYVDSDTTNRQYKLSDNLNDAIYEFVVLYNKFFFSHLLDQRRSAQNESEV